MDLKEVPSHLLEVGGYADRITQITQGQYDAVGEIESSFLNSEDHDPSNIEPMLMKSTFKGQFPNLCSLKEFCVNQGWEVLVIEKWEESQNFFHDSVVSRVLNKFESATGIRELKSYIEFSNLTLELLTDQTVRDQNNAIVESSQTLVHVTKHLESHSAIFNDQIKELQFRIMDLQPTFQKLLALGKEIVIDSQGRDEPPMQEKTSFKVNTEKKFKIADTEYKIVRIGGEYKIKCITTSKPEKSHIEFLTELKKMPIFYELVESSDPNSIQEYIDKSFQLH